QNGFDTFPCPGAWVFQLRERSCLRASSANSENCIAHNVSIYSTRTAYCPAATQPCSSAGNWVFPT
ncbi:MAG: hypothetical protein WBV98_14930, partial [Candidatus Sulfotelmatobacter sp.]